MSKQNRQKGAIVAADQNQSAQSEDQTTAQQDQSAQQPEGAAADQGQAVQGTGDTADAEDAAKGDATQDTPAPAPVAPQEPAKQEAESEPEEVSAFEKMRAKVRAEGLQAARVVVDTMDGYMQAMKPGLPVSDDEVVLQQNTLWRLLQRVFGDENQDAMTQGTDVLVAYFTEYRKTALAEVYVFRGAELMTLPQEQMQAFHAALNVLHIAAATGVKSVKKHADLNRSFTEQVYSDVARNNILSYFN